MAEISKIQPFGSSAQYDLRDTSKLPLSGGTLTGNLGIQFGDSDKHIIFDYDGDNTAGASWRLAALGSGTGDTNYFTIESGTNDITSKTWYTAIRIGQNTFDTAFGGNVYPLTNNAKTLGTSSNKWSTVYATTLDGNATSASRLNITSTDNAIARFDGTNGTIQDSTVTIDDNGSVHVTTGDGIYFTGKDGLVAAFKLTSASAARDNIDMGWEWSSIGGAGAAFRSSASNGQFIFFARTKNSEGTAVYTQLVGTPEGSLTWGGQEVIRTGNGDSRYLRLSGGTMTGALNFQGSDSRALTWNDGTWWQRIQTTDDAVADTPVFTFQQSENTSGSTWKDLLTIRDNGKIVLLPNIGGLYKLYSSGSTTPFLQVNSNNLDVSILKIDGNNPTDIRDSQSYGFNLKYMGLGSGSDNTLRLYGDNSDGTDQLAMEWSGDGKVGIGTTYNTNYRLNVNGIGYFNDGLRIIRNEASADAGPDAIVYIENKNAADWAFKITKDIYNYGIKIDGTGSNLLNIGTNNVVTIHESTTSGSGSLRMNGTVYFANGTTYYINNNANANLLDISGRSLGVSSTAGTGAGISLYEGAKGTSAPVYGLTFMTTGNGGKYGDVQGDWATYFTMNTNNQRGWIFKTYNQTLESYMATSISARGTLSSKAIARSGDGLILAPNGAYFKDTASSKTGAIKITLPVSWSATMINFKVDIYDYSDQKLVTYHIGGYNYTGGDGYWTCCSCYANGRGDKSNLTVRWGHDGTKCCIIIGEINTSWSYPKISIRDVSIGHSGDSISNWSQNWVISWITELPENIDVTKTNPNVLPIDYGGTGATTTAGARTNLNVPTRTGGDASGTWGINITGNAATATKLSNTPNNTTTFLRGDNTWSNEVIGILKASKLTLTSTDGTEHINFTRTGGGDATPNYINVPINSALAVSVGGAGGINIRMCVNNTAIHSWTDNIMDLGTSSIKWKNVYANAFKGNADTATKATQDSDGNAINTTYVKKSGDTMTGTLQIDNTSGIKINSHNTDLKVWEVVGNAGLWNSEYGFHELYKGASSGNDNTLELYAHNQTSSHVKVRTIKQDGTVTWHTAHTIIAPIAELNLKSNNAANYSILRLNTAASDGAGIIFMNGASRTTDGGANTMTIRNNIGDLRLDDNVNVTGTLSLNSNLLMPGTGAIVWNSGTWWQRIAITDDSNADTPVFSFQQSENTSGSSWTTLAEIYDNGKIITGNLSIGGTINTDMGKTISSTSTLYLNRGNNASVVFQRGGTNKIWLDTSDSFRPETDYTLSIGDATHRWNEFYGNVIKLCQDAAQNPSTSSRARIEFNYVNGQAVHIAYTPNDSYRNPAGLKIMGNGLTSGEYSSPAWLEVEGSFYAGSSIYAGASVYITKAGECGVEVNNTQTTNPHSGLLGVGSSGNLGIYDKKYNKWIVYSDPSGNVGLNGNAATATSATKATQDSDGNQINTTYLKKSGGTMTGNLGIQIGDTDKHIIFDYDGDGTSGASWRIAALGSGSGDTNYFTIDSGTSAVAETTWNTAIRVGMNTFDTAFGGNVYPLINNTKTLGTSGNKWSVVYATTFNGNATSATTAGSCTGNAATATTATNATNIYSSASTSKAYVLGTLTASSANHGTVYNASVYTEGTVLYGAAWNDYAEKRQVEADEMRPGMCVREIGDDTMQPTTERLQRGCKIISDTYGFCIGETNTAKTPIAVSGRVLAYIYEGREAAKHHIGYGVCSGPNGTVSIMTEEEERMYPMQCIGTISAVPDYETWGENNINVDGRVWIYVR